jgi:hypothetical protein
MAHPTVKISSATATYQSLKEYCRTSSLRSRNPQKAPANEQATARKTPSIPDPFSPAAMIAPIRPAKINLAAKGPGEVRSPILGSLSATSSLTANKVKIRAVGSFATQKAHVPSTGIYPSHANQQSMAIGVIVRSPVTNPSRGIAIIHDNTASAIGFLNRRLNVKCFPGPAKEHHQTIDQRARPLRQKK